MRRFLSGSSWAVRWCGCGWSWRGHRGGDLASVGYLAVRCYAFGAAVTLGREFPADGLGEGQCGYVRRLVDGDGVLWRAVGALSGWDVGGAGIGAGCGGSWRFSGLSRCGLQYCADAGEFCEGPSDGGAVALEHRGRFSHLGDHDIGRAVARGGQP